MGFLWVSCGNWRGPRRKSIGNRFFEIFKPADRPAAFAGARRDKPRYSRQNIQIQAPAIGEPLRDAAVLGKPARVVGVDSDHAADALPRWNVGICGVFR